MHFLGRRGVTSQTCYHGDKVPCRRRVSAKLGATVAGWWQTLWRVHWITMDGSYLKNAHIHAETLIHKEISKICSTLFEICCLYVQYRDPKISRDSTQASCFLCTFLLMSLQAFHVGITLTACFLKAAGNRILCYLLQEVHSFAFDTACIKTSIKTSSLLTLFCWLWVCESMCACVYAC